MPLNKRKPFIPKPTPIDLRPDEKVFYLKITNEIFRDYDEYFDRVIMCNSLVWTCSVTGKAGLTFEEALESEKQAQKTLHSFSPDLKKALLYLLNHTYRGRVSDVIEDVFAYSKEHYFVGETVLAVIAKLWCHCRVLEVIPPTTEEIEKYRKELEIKGELQENDYFVDDTWGPPPDLFHYMVIELDPDDPKSNIPLKKELIDIKREKLTITKEKLRYLIKSAAYYNEDERVWRIKEDINKALRLKEVKFDGGMFKGKVPIFEKSLGPLKRQKSHKTSMSPPGKAKENTSPNQSQPKKRSSLQNGVNHVKKKLSDKKGKPISQPKKEILTPEQEKQRELERKAKERETQKEEKKLISDFRKLWMKPKEDLDVEDLLELPIGDPVDCKVPVELFGDFVMVLEHFNSFSTFLRVKDCFPQGFTFDTLERALLKNEVAGPLNDILQLLLRAIFRLQEREAVEVTQEEKAAVELSCEENSGDVSMMEAVEQATAAATWSLMYQNTSIYNLTLDHLSLSEILRLHLLSAGARATDKDIKWRLQMRGGYTNLEDPGLLFRFEEPQVLKTLSQGTIFDLTFRERLKLIVCLIHQLLSYNDLRDVIDQSIDQFKETRQEIRTLQAAERRRENEDNLWRMRLKTDRVVPHENFMKAPQTPSVITEKTRLLSEEEIEGFINKRVRETGRRKEDFEIKLNELTQKMIKSERKIGSHPLGKDRAHRRYWVFLSLPGIFIEDDDENKGSCLGQATPHIPNVDIQNINFVKQHFKRLQLEDPDANPGVISAASRKSLPKVFPSSQAHAMLVWSCTGDPHNCPVHSKKITRPKWSFYSTEEQLDQLVSNLSPRGLREKELRQVVMDEAIGLREHMKKCPAQKLNTEKTYPEPQEKRTSTRQGSKNALDPNLCYPPKTPIETILELQLRDIILEAEEKIFLGTLGSLKVKDRQAWIKGIEGRGYDSQTSVLRWGHNKSLSSEDDQSKEASSSTTSADSLARQESTIRDLASAILQLEQSIEPKFLKRPLGTSDISEKESDKKKKGGSDLNHLKPNWLEGTPLERWETSLMKSTTFSQLFVHYFTLDKSISWNRSVLNARCRICRRKGDAENMLLCDGCNKGHHAYCFKPPLEEIPKGDWFCTDCAPPPLPPRPARKQQGKESEEDSEEDEVNPESDDDAMPVLEEETAEFCIVCGGGGEVICCDGCPALYHLECLHPPKTRVPRGLWFCDGCKEVKDKKEQKTKKKKVWSRKRKYSESDEDETEEEEDVTPDTDDEESEEEDTVPVKVRIQSPRKHITVAAAPPALSGESDGEEVTTGRGSKRKSAYQAVLNISKAAKILRTDSKENESSESSMDF